MIYPKWGESSVYDRICMLQRQTYQVNFVCHHRMRFKCKYWKNNSGKIASNGTKGKRNYSAWSIYLQCSASTLRMSCSNEDEQQIQKNWHERFLESDEAEIEPPIPTKEVYQNRLAIMVNIGWSWPISLFDLGQLPLQGEGAKLENKQVEETILWWKVISSCKDAEKGVHDRGKCVKEVYHIYKMTISKSLMEVEVEVYVSWKNI